MTLWRRWGQGLPQWTHLAEGVDGIVWLSVYSAAAFEEYVRKAAAPANAVIDQPFLFYLVACSHPLLPRAFPSQLHVCSDALQARALPERTGRNCLDKVAGCTSSAMPAGITSTTKSRGGFPSKQKMTFALHMISLPCRSGLLHPT